MYSIYVFEGIYNGFKNKFVFIAVNIQVVKNGWFGYTVSDFMDNFKSKFKNTFIFISEFFSR